MRWLFLLVLCGACSNDAIVHDARRKCWNEMQMAATHAESIAALRDVAYQSALTGTTTCSHLDSIPRRK